MFLVVQYKYITRNFFMVKNIINQEIKNGSKIKMILAYKFLIKYL